MKFSVKFTLLIYQECTFDESTCEVSFIELALLNQIYHLHLNGAVLINHPLICVFVVCMGDLNN